MVSPEQVKSETEQVVRELVQAGGIKAGQLVVFGVSTSEVAGKTIGTAGARKWAEAIYSGIEAVRADVSFVPVFQCCEHLNRALVIEQDDADRSGLDRVSAVPVPKAGGAMAAYAYRNLQHPCLVESIRAHAGIDIGDTLIGMHLQPVAVPVRPSVKKIGHAHVTMAYTRPKLIGGARAVYTVQPEDDCI